ncbi:N-acetylglucosamine kinase [Brevibacillus humidisoli]|uniref:N-acetylglucosamine kinase n=1 Tax=Brevibacillus humidisoli TaxID=2895522 RepID=UPI001E6149A1|nr:BadF/BadG/BcrA/BcrD ATPase family protein [Brevibacillus humidisoli]UFJ41441.1 N-acetylglucosamine kinase [Brevibacillus humidisoli]
MRSNNRYVIGIDGGGTKTVAALADGRGEIISTARGDSSNMQSRPFAEVEQTLTALINRLLQEAGIKRTELDAIFFGLAGADRPEAKQRIAASSLAGDGSDRVVIDNDAVTALYSGTWGKPGIVLIAGTGSIAYGISEQGERCRVGGWGYLLGDEGSGFDLGQQALTAVMRQFDGRGRPTVLTELILQQTGLADPAGLVHYVYSAPNVRKRVAEASYLLLDAAARGDQVASEILHQAADSLAELVQTCAEKCGSGLPVVVAGGLLAEDTQLRREVLARLSPACDVILPELPPVVGALVMALQEAGIEVDEQVRKTITDGWIDQERMNRHDG